VLKEEFPSLADAQPDMPLSPKVAGRSKDREELLRRRGVDESTNSNSNSNSDLGLGDRNHSAHFV
jgi:hypothetical protein